MSDFTPVRDRAKRIRRIRKVREGWQHPWLWHNHLTASHEFQLLDVLRDIRFVLSLILLVLMLNTCAHDHKVEVVVPDAERAIRI